VRKRGLRSFNFAAQLAKEGKNKWLMGVFALGIQVAFKTLLAGKGAGGTKLERTTL
jgi:hypothetical protein